MKSRFINNLSKSCRKVVDKTKPYALAIALTGFMLTSNVAFAAGAKDLFQVILKVLGAFCTAGGAWYGVNGLIAYAEAKSEGEGPQMAKAQNKIYAALLLIILGIALFAGSSTIASLIIDSITL